MILKMTMIKLILSMTVNVRRASSISWIKACKCTLRQMKLSVLSLMATTTIAIIIRIYWISTLAKSKHCLLQVRINRLKGLASSRLVHVWWWLISTMMRMMMMSMGTLKVSLYTRNPIMASVDSIQRSEHRRYSCSNNSNQSKAVMGIMWKLKSSKILSMQVEVE